MKTCVLLFALLAFFCGQLSAADYDPARWGKKIIVPACADPMQCEIAADGRVFFIERGGAVNVAEPRGRRRIASSRSARWR